MVDLTLQHQNDTFLHRTEIIKLLSLVEMVYTQIIPKDLVVNLVFRRRVWTNQLLAMNIMRNYSYTNHRKVCSEINMKLNKLELPEFVVIVLKFQQWFAKRYRQDGRV